MMYFGTKDRMDWIPCPAVDRPASLQSPNGTLEYENGGAFVRRQYAAHRNYEMTWNFLPNAEAEKIEAWAQGTWGKGPYYWVDPMIARGNMLPMDWAFPGSVNLGAAPLLPVQVTDIPVPNPLPGSPIRGVRYSTDTNFLTGSPRRVFLPIPPEHSLTFATSAIPNRLDIFVQTYPVAGGDPAAGRQVQSSGYGGHFETFRGDVVRGIELYIGPTPGGTGERSIDLHWMTAVLRPGLTPQPTLPPRPRNVFTNPRLEGSGEWVETARNYFIQPILDSYDINVIESWAGSSNTQNLSLTEAPWAKSGHAFTVEYTAVVTTTNGDVGPRPVIAAPRVFIPLQEEWTIAYTVMTNTAGTISAPAHSGVVRSATSGDFEAEPGTPYRIWSTFQRNASEPFPTNTRISITHRGKQAGTTLSIADVDLYPGAYQPNREFFVPNAPSPDPDMRVRFLGAENASASVMEIETVRGVLAARCIAGKSTFDGKPAIRQIPTSAGDRHITIPGITGWGDKTLLVNVSVPDLEDWTGLSWQPGSIQYSATPWTQLYREDDDFPYLWREHNLGAPGYRLRHSSGSTSQFDGDVYWTDLGVYEGEYTGAPADGDTPGWMWEGTPGDSASYDASYRPAEIPQWTPGIGHSGCEFTEHPERVDYSAALDKVGVTANLKEVGSWL